MNEQQYDFNVKSDNKSTGKNSVNLNNSQDTIKLMSDNRYNIQQPGFKNVDSKSTEQIEKFDNNVDNDIDEKTDIDYSNYNKSQQKMENYNEENSKNNTLVNVIDTHKKSESNQFEDYKRVSSIKSINSKKNSSKGTTTIKTPDNDESKIDKKE